MKKYIIILGIALAILATCQSMAQDMLVPTRLSQKATITQRIGTTDVTIVYHSPSARGRKIFGGIVPYDFTVDGKEYPWRAGSNENTTIEFSQDIMIDGQPLAKGKYGLHVYVEKEFWTFIFSSNAEIWGSFSYNQEEDALRTRVKVESAAHQEWLSYNFVERKAASSRVELQWTDVKASFEVSVDVTANAFAERNGKEEKSATDYAYMAQLILKMDSSKIDEALGYINQSIDVETTFQNKMIKAKLLKLKGDKKGAKALEKEALSQAKNFDWYYYALGFLFLDGDQEKALQILSDQLKKEPTNYPVNLALGEYYIKMGDQEMATKYFKAAYDNAGERSKNYTRYMYLSNKLILENQ